MATVDVLTPSDDLAFKNAAEAVAKEPTEQEQLDFLRRAIADLGQPGNIEIFKKAMKDLGVRAVQTDNGFARIKNTMDGFVKRHGGQFPGIIPFQTEWNGYKTKWSSYITTSRDLAIKTAAEYEDYTAQLNLVNAIKTKEDMVALAASLKDFAKNKPVGIPVDFKDKFLDLKRDVEYFQEKFNKYLKEQKAELTEKAQTLSNQIKALQEEIKGLDKQIEDATLGLKISAIFGLVGLAIAGTALAILSKKRSDKQGSLDGLRSQLRQVEANQAALAEMKAQFDGLIPDFQLLSGNLGLFADTWNSFHNQAVDFAAKFENVESPSALTLLYKARVELALKVSVPLSRGLRDYAAAIHL